MELLLKIAAYLILEKNSRNSLAPIILEIRNESPDGMWNHRFGIEGDYQNQTPMQGLKWFL